MKPKMHPLAEIYAEAERVHTHAQEHLRSLRAELRSLEAELEALERELAKDYGAGYLTLKTVRNRSGRKYRYPVWRTTDSSEIYLTRDPRAKRILELREKVRRLRRLITEVKQASRLAWAYMKASNEYMDTCISPEGEYVECKEPRVTD